MQFESEMQDTRVNVLPPRPLYAFGIGCRLQRLPFQRSASATLPVDAK
jgi:hypothetical protein